AGPRTQPSRRRPSTAFDLPELTAGSPANETAAAAPRRTNLPGDSPRLLHNPSRYPARASGGTLPGAWRRGEGGTPRGRWPSRTARGGDPRAVGSGSASPNLAALRSTARALRAGESAGWPHGSTG